MFRVSLILTILLFLELIVSELFGLSGLGIGLAGVVICSGLILQFKYQLWTRLLGVFVYIFAYSFLFQINPGVLLLAAGGGLLISGLLSKYLKSRALNGISLSLGFFNFYLVGLAVVGIYPSIPSFLIMVVFATLIYLSIENFVLVSRKSSKLGFVGKKYA